MNKKGFTLVELLASMAILAILMLVAVPSTINVLDRSKKQKYIQDAKRMITLAEAYIRGNEDISYPAGNQIVVLYLSRLNDGTFDEDPDGNKYDEDNSFVTITYKQEGTNYSYDYHVKLVGEGTKRGVMLSNLTELNSDKKYDYVVKGITDMTCSSISTKVLGNACDNCCIRYE